MNELKYKQGQEIIFVKGGLSGKKGEVGAIDSDDDNMPYLIYLSDGGLEWASEGCLMSLDELQTLRTENERLRAAFTDLSTRVLPTLYSDAPTESVASLLYYLSAMATEMKTIVDEAIK